jgi:hypothetical protein
MEPKTDSDRSNSNFFIIWLFHAKVAKYADSGNEMPRQGKDLVGELSNFSEQRAANSEQC